MRHVYARGIIAMIWLIAAAVSGASGKTADAVRYVILGGLFFCSAYAARKSPKKTISEGN